MASQPKLSYFDIRGFAETSRLLFAVAGVPFEDHRFPLKIIGPGNYERKEFDEAKAANAFPFGQVPVLEVNGVQIAQSRAIERYIAREYGLFGSNNLETAQIDMFSEQLNDFATEFRKANYWAKPEEKEALLASFYETHLPKHLATLEARVGAPSAKPNLFEVQLYNFFEILDQAKLAPALEHAPKLAAIRKAVASYPAIAHHVATRPVTPF